MVVFRSVQLRSAVKSSLIPVSVVIPTLNEADRLARCLKSVDWAAEVIVADAGSTDGTVAIARSLGARVLELPGLTIAGQRNAAMAVASFPWVLSLDADECASPELATSIGAAIETPVADAYRIHFRNQYLGAPMERGGWGRDRHIRFARTELRWKVKRVHERLDYDGPVAELCGRIDHDSYRNLEHQLRKVTTYADWGAEDLARRGTAPGVSHLVIRPLWRFVKCYFLQGAWREGRRGLILGVVHAWSAFAKYAILWDKQRVAHDSPRALAIRSGWSDDIEARTIDTAVSREPVPGMM